MRLSLVCNFARPNFSAFPWWSGAGTQSLGWAERSDINCPLAVVRCVMDLAN
jgi:hypothetical protein